MWGVNHPPHLTFKLRVIVRTICSSEQHHIPKVAFWDMYVFQSLSEKLKEAEEQDELTTMIFSKNTLMANDILYCKEDDTGSRVQCFES